MFFKGGRFTVDKYSYKKYFDNDHKERSSLCARGKREGTALYNIKELAKRALNNENKHKVQKAMQWQCSFNNWASMS